MQLVELHDLRKISAHQASMQKQTPKLSDINKYSRSDQYHE